MRKLLGSLVLIAGVGGLGYVAWSDAAPRMQAAIQENAQTVARAAQHGVQVHVSGRDVTVTGRVTDQTERAVLQATFEGINGVRVVDIAGVETLPIADPFEMTAARGADGTTTLSGVIPSDADREILGQSGAPLTLAAGAPDEAWARAVSIGVDALGNLKTGELIVSDRTLTLTGLALTPTQEAAANAAMADLPDGYTASSQIDVEDDGTPLRLIAILTAGRVAATGKFPEDMPLSDFTDRFEAIETVMLDQAVIPAADPDWPDMARNSMDALASLIDGRLNIDGPDVSLTGAGTPDGKSRAEALLAALPDHYAITSDITLWDDGAPLSLSMDWDGTLASATGKYPADFTPRGPAGVRVDDNGVASFLADETGAFTANANAGVTALGLMSTGTLSVTDDTITLSGTAASPQVGVEMDSVLASVAQTTAVERDITYLDDGSPAAWSLQYSATTGAMVEGRLPTGLASADIAAALGVASLSGNPATALEDDTVGSSLDTLALAAEYLPEAETLTYTNDETGSALDLILSPGVDLDLVAVDLAERLPTDVSFSIGPLEDLPADGATRTNVASGLDEVFTQGFWLPDLDFTTDPQGCGAASDAILASAKINFLSGSARLDATSIRAINGLAAVVGPCLDAGLALEIGGHTDATGDAFSNDELSFDRAAAVRIALITRGISDRYMSSVGYGQTQPIADNATPEGRAANRRTTLTWSTITPPAEPEPAPETVPETTDP